MIATGTKREREREIDKEGASKSTDASEGETEIKVKRHYTTLKKQQQLNAELYLHRDLITFMRLFLCATLLAIDSI